MRLRLSRIDLRQVGLPVAVLVMIVVFAMRSDVFMTATNFQNVGLQAAALACVACGQTFVILTAGLDLSVGSTVALVSVVCAMGFRDHGWWAGIGFGLLAGLVVGLVNGLVVTRLRVAPFIATLAMLSVASGVALNLSGGTPLTGLPLSFTSLAYARVASFPLPVIIAIALLILAYLVLRVSRLGRHIYATGGNSEAARLSGINVRDTEVAAYMICALLAAVGGLILTARVASGQPTLGSDLALQSVAAVVLGGVSLFGGRGSMVGVAVGVIFVSILSNGLNLLGVSSYTQLMVIGVAMVVAIAWDQYLGRKWRTRGEAV
jgi:ribose transport system permease protein